MIGEEPHARGLLSDRLAFMLVPALILFDFYWAASRSRWAARTLAHWMETAPRPPSSAWSSGCGGCGVGEFCLWMDANQQGCLWHGATVSDDFRKDRRYTTCPDRSPNDSISSYRNDRGADWYVMWENPKDKGAAYCIGPKASGNVDPAFNDRASSSGIYGNDDMTPEARKACKWIDTD